jgi:hypothetical protein
MLRYKLRTLLIVLALGPIVLAGAWNRYDQWSRKGEAQRELDAVFNQILRAKPDPTLSSTGNPFFLDMQTPPKPAE